LIIGTLTGRHHHLRDAKSIEEFNQIEEAERIATEQVKINKRTGMNMSLNFHGVGFSFIDQEPKELIYVCLNKIICNYSYDTEIEDNGDIDTNTNIDL